MTSLAEALGGKRRIIGGPFGSKLTQGDYVESGVPVIRGSNMQHSGRWIGGNYAYISQEKYLCDLKSNTARPGDIIVTQRGTLGQVSIVPEESEHSNFVVSQSQMAVRVDEREANRDFVYYFLTSPIFDDYVENATIQTGVPHINLGILREVQVNWPDLPTQCAIAKTLASLDSKIELNRQMNETLEEMAQALFRDWFVDFGPTRRQMEGATDPVAIMGGAFPAEKATILASLFPAALGAIDLPEGWIKKEVGEFGRLRGGKQLPKTEFVENGAFPVFGGAGHMGNADKFNADGFVITVGRVGAYCGNFVAHRGKAWVNNNASFFDLPHSMQAEWFYLSLQALDLEPIKKGAAQPFVSNGDINALELVDPGSQVREAANDVLALLLTKAEANSKEARTLAHLRDLLLPKLMTGEIRLGAAEAAA